jgi:hypothetical protein
VPHTTGGDVAVPSALAEPVWRARQAEHEQAVDDRLAGHLRRRRTGVPHPVEDFLFTYYRTRPAQLRRWHPGVGTALLAAPDRRSQRWYGPVRATGADGRVAEATGLDVPAFVRDRGAGLRLLAQLLAATAARPARLGCFGLHEWAMVYRLPAGTQRHDAWPLRLGPAATDEVVRSHRIACTHFDAFRFFTPDAVPRNTVQPTRPTAPALEQPGCLHATMDLYRAACQLGPAVPGALLLRCFDLARDVRVLDMQASPYDLAALGYPPVRIETADGKAEYAARQAAFASRGQELRAELLGVLSRLGVTGAADAGAVPVAAAQ